MQVKKKNYYNGIILIYIVSQHIVFCVTVIYESNKLIRFWRERWM